MADSSLPLPGAEPAEVVLEGQVQRVVFRAVDGEFTVLRLAVAGAEPVAVVGAMGHVVEGDTLQVRGRFEAHPQYGRRLRAEQALPITPRTTAGLERYLSTLDGLGPETARRVVGELGLKALDALTAEPWRVAQIKGVGKRRAQKAAAAAAARESEREVMVFLLGEGISPKYAARIRKVYGEAAMARVRENPYRLAREVPGIGFQVADRIAKNMGVSPRSPLRVEAGVLYALEGGSDLGHCFLPMPELEARAAAELRLEPGADGLPRGQAPPPPGPEVAALIQDAVASLRGQGAVLLEDDAVFLPRLLRAEQALAARLGELCGAARGLVPPILKHAPLNLALGQRAALRMVETSPVSIITGGPGTGKTTIVRALCKAYLAASRTVLLTAPTGRAAKRLSEATGQRATTVHRLLEWAPGEAAGFRRRADRPLEADLIVCDEASMLDLPLARALIAAVPPGATLVLVGDVDQLPSVGPGRVLADLIESERVPVTRLKEIFRQAEGSGIVEAAHRILHAELPQPTPKGQEGDFYVVETEDPKEAQDLVVRLVAERIPKRFGLDPFKDVQVLAPMHRGEAGTQELNRALQARLNSRPAGEGELRGPGRALRRGDKVMQVRNDYDRDVWNGDVGIVTSIDPEAGAALVQFDERSVAYDPEELDQLELAYAVSVHKSQGSEYPAVVLPLLMQHYMMLRRNLLYTAVTRGKRLVVIVGSRRALRRAVNELGDLGRYTRLMDRLRVILPP